MSKSWSQVCIQVKELAPDMHPSQRVGLRHASKSKSWPLASRKPLHFTVADIIIVQGDNVHLEELPMAGTHQLTRWREVRIKTAEVRKQDKNTYGRRLCNQHNCLNYKWPHPDELEA